jgi:hypothetical protein
LATTGNLVQGPFEDIFRAPREMWLQRVARQHCAVCACRARETGVLRRYDGSQSAISVI